MVPFDKFACLICTFLVRYNSPHRDTTIAKLNYKFLSRFQGYPNKRSVAHFSIWRPRETELDVLPSHTYTDIVHTSTYDEHSR